VRGYNSISWGSRVYNQHTGVKKCLNMIRGRNVKKPQVAKQLNKVKREEVAARGAAQKAAKHAERIAKEIVPSGTFSNAGSSLGGLAGRALGTLVGGGAGGQLASQIGSGIGKLLGKGLATVVGFGDYDITENSLYRKSVATSEGVELPQFANSHYGTTVQHREFIGDVLAPPDPAAFSITTFDVNPGNGVLFPWFSQVANGFQQYRLRGMIFEFRSMSTDFSTVGALGTVALATNYNVLDDEYNSMIELQNSEYAMSAKPSASQLHPIECAPDLTSVPLKYVRNSAHDPETQSQDARLYDHCRFQIATEGLPPTVASDTVIGQLWVTYDIELYKPLLSNWGHGSGTMQAINVDKTNIFGEIGSSAASIVRGKSLRHGTSNNTYQITRAGEYLMVLQLNGTGLSDQNVLQSVDIGPTAPYALDNTPMHSDSLWLAGVTTPLVPFYGCVQWDPAQEYFTQFAVVRITNPGQQFAVATGSLGGGAATITESALTIYPTSLEVLVGPNRVSLMRRGVSLQLPARVRREISEEAAFNKERRSRTTKPLPADKKCSESKSTFNALALKCRNGRTWTAGELADFDHAVDLIANDIKAVKYFLMLQFDLAVDADSGFMVGSTLGPAFGLPSAYVSTKGESDFASVVDHIYKNKEHWLT